MGGGGGGADFATVVLAGFSGCFGAVIFFGGTFGAAFGAAFCLLATFWGVRRTFLAAFRFVGLRNLGRAAGFRGGETSRRDFGARPPGINNEPPPTEGETAPVRGAPNPPSLRTLRSTLTSDVLKS
jgi:hypothetical protein